MSRTEIGMLWFGGMAFILSFSGLIIWAVDKAKPLVQGIHPRVEVFKRGRKNHNYRKVS